MAVAVEAFFRKHLVSSCGLPSYCCCCHLLLLRQLLHQLVAADDAKFYLPATPAPPKKKRVVTSSGSSAPADHKSVTQATTLAYLISRAQPGSRLAIRNTCLRFREPEISQILLVLINQKRMCHSRCTQTQIGQQQPLKKLFFFSRCSSYFRFLPFSSTRTLGGRVFLPPLAHGPASSTHDDGEKKV